MLHKEIQGEVNFRIKDLQVTRNFFDVLAESWDARQPNDRVNLLEAILLRFSDILAGSSSILDVGAGTGTLLTVLQKLAPSSQLFAVDLSQNMLSKAAGKILPAHLCQADFIDSPYANHSFNTVICHNCLPHLLPLEKALQELHRVLKPGGTLIILHDLGRLQVNAKHQNSPCELIRSHLIPPLVELEDQLEVSGFQLLVKEDLDCHFLVTATPF